MSRPLHLAMVTTFYPPHHFGGDAVFVYRLARALAEAGHRVDVVHSVDAWRAGGGVRAAEGWPEHPGVNRIPLEAGRIAAVAAHQTGHPIFYAPSLRRVLEQPGLDAIHFHNASLVGGPGVLGLGSAPKLYTAHEYWLICATHVLFRYGREACTRRTCLRCTLRARRPPQAWRFTGAVQRGLDHVDRLLLPSRFARDKHAEQGLDLAMEVLPPFVPVPAELPAEDADGRPFFLVVGRLETLKGVHTLLPLFRGEGPAELVVAGDGSQEEELRRRADGCRVRFVGRLDQDALASLYRRAVAVLAPSLCYETFGLTVAEGMAWETPAVVRGHGALTELVEDSGGGIAASTPEEWRSALDRLLDDPDHRRTLGLRARRHAVATWTRQAHLGRYLDLVAELGERAA